MKAGTKKSQYRLLFCDLMVRNGIQLARSRRRIKKSHASLGLILISEEPELLWSYAGKKSDPCNSGCG